MPKKEIVSLTREAAIKLTMDQDVIKEYTSSWNIVNVHFQAYEDDDLYVFIKTDRTSSSAKKTSDSTIVN